MLRRLFYDFISECPGGLDYNVGQFGSRLSGGQRQKISIARAILSKPDWLILDEPTTSLDALSANEIAATIDKLHGEMTILIVAHQPNIVNCADHVIVVNQDHTIVDGTPKTLMAANSFYQALMNQELEAASNEG